MDRFHDINTWIGSQLNVSIWWGISTTISNSFQFYKIQKDQNLFVPFCDVF